jgi:hypothetical protein
MLRSIGIILTLLALPELVLAQGNQIYDGPYEVLDYHGEAQFEYRILDQDTVFNGPFRMEQSSLDALLNQGDRFFLFEGDFIEDLPQNHWTLQFGEFQKGSGTAVSNYQYNVKINGSQHEASGVLIDGKPQGEWTHEVVRIENSEVGELLFRSTIQFEDGIPRRNFKIEDENYVLMGRFLRDGLAHDQWELYPKDGLGSAETWVFSNGRLNRIVVNGLQQAGTIPGFTETMTNELVVNLDQRYTELLRLRQKLSHANNVDLEDGMVKMLAANAGYYKKVDEIISALGKSSFMPEFKVKVAHYPLSDAERAHLDSIDSLSNEANKMVAGMLESTQLRLLKLSDEEVLYLMTLVDTLSREWLNPMLEISQYYKNGILDHVDRNNLTRLWPGNAPKPSFEIAYEFDQQQKVRTFNSSFDGHAGDDTVEEIHALAERTHRELSVIEQKLNKERAQKEREQELEQLEEQLIAQQTCLNNSIDSLSQELSDPEKTVTQSIKTRAALLLSEYSSLEDLDQKPAQAGQLISCFQYMDSLATEVAMLPERWEEIQQEYRDDVWNPFTAIVMSEEIKKRITESYRQVLIPYYLDQITSNLSCTNAQPLLQSLTSVHNRMLELKEEDTKRIERKLKKEDEAEVIIELLEIVPLFD